jgi:DnaK suppressor protein
VARSRRTLPAAVLDELGRRLREARRELLRSIATTDEELGTLTADREPGALSEGAGREQAQEVLSRLEGRDRDRLEEIHHALQRIVDGTFGACGRCGGAIPLVRLRAQPSTRYCLTCETILEGRSS